MDKALALAILMVGMVLGWFAAPAGATPAAPEPGSATAATFRYLRENARSLGLRESDLSRLQLVARDVSPDGITHLRFNQVLNGIESFDHGVEAHVTEDGRMVGPEVTLVPGASLSSWRPEIGARRGLREAREAVNGEDALPEVTGVGPGPARFTEFASGETTRLRWTEDSGEPVLAWQSIAEDGSGGLHDVLVDAGDGDLLRRRSLTSELGEARYFPLDPDSAPAIQIVMPPSWISGHAGGTRLWGEYARTYTDSGDENPAAGEELGGTRVQIPASNADPLAPEWLYTQSHDFPGATPCAVSGCTWDSGVPGSTEVNQFQAGTNLHVLVSRFHGHLAKAPIGFDEASGNFQLTNHSGQGLGGDYVRAELNDGGGLNNANMSTPPDGQPPRMQMFLFDRRDVNGADSAEVVYHEYGHGLSGRLVVNASGSSTLNSLQSRMMGEGWSDFYALDALVAEGTKPDTGAPGELTTGEYVVGPPGIRAKPIDCPVNPGGLTGCDGTRGSPVAGGYTYGDLAITVNTTPHNGGEVWAETLWDIRKALGREAALELITGGMRLTTENPSMLDARDGILRQAVATRTAAGAPDDFYGALWQLFAARGFGAGATTTGPDATDPVESYALPSGIRAGKTTIRDPYPGGDDDGRIEAGERFVVDQVVEGIGPVDLPGVTGTLSSSDPAVRIEDGSARWPLLGKGRAAINSDELAGRLPAGICSATSGLSIEVSSPEGGTTAAAVIDPRPGSNEPVPIPEPGGTPEDPELKPLRQTFTVPSGGAVTDVDLRIDELRHGYLGDLSLALEHDGVTVEIVDRFGDEGFDGADIIDAVFDDEAAGPPSTGTSPVSGRVKPSGSLAAFDGHPAAGDWTLTVVDHYPDEVSTGELREWGIDSPEAGCGRLEIPAAVTEGVERLTFSSAGPTGSVTPNGRATAARIVLGETKAYARATDPQPVGQGKDPVPVRGLFGGLRPGTTYHYRVEALRKGRVAIVGEDRKFTTRISQEVQDVTRPRIEGPVEVRLGKPRDGGRRRAEFRFSLSEPAKVRVYVTRSVTGIRRGRRCVAGGGRRGKCCHRRVAVRSDVVLFRSGGPVTVTLRGRGLSRGRYRARFMATDAAGNRSVPRLKRFRTAGTTRSSRRASRW